MKNEQKLVWRFYDKTTKSIEYGLGESIHKYEDPRYLAMRRLKQADSLGGELFDGDVVQLQSDPANLYYASADDQLVSGSGAVVSVAEIGRYVVTQQEPLHGLISETATVA